MSPVSSQRIGVMAGKASEGAKEAGRRIVTPGFLEKPLEEAGKPGQMLAALLLWVIIPVSLTLIRVAHDLMISLLLNNRVIGARESTPFFITLATLVLLVVTIWFWFQWVRSAGFGYLNIEFGGDS